MTINPLGNLSLPQLKRAVTIREQLDSLTRELDRIIGGRPSTPKNSVTSRKRKLSAKARARISAAMKARWARRKGRKRLSSQSRLARRARRPVALRARKASSNAPLKERIIRALKAAGNSGASVKDLSVKLGTSYGNVSVWFHTTGKGVKEIKKVAPGRFAWAS